MEKRSKKPVIGHDKHHHSGCMQGLINIFDFRHGRPSQKLLADKRHGSWRITGAASHELNTLDGSCGPAKVGEPCETATSGKMSVKELMEKEMFNQDQLTKMNKSNIDPKQSVSHQFGRRRRNRWHTNKTSFDISDVNITNEEPTHRRHKSLSSLEVGEMMAELCTEINVKDAGLLLPPKEDPSVIEEKLAEATKMFVSQFVNGKNVRDAKFQPSRELVDALQTLNSNKDVFLKLLQDPSSQLAKHVQKLVDQRAGQEHGKSKHQSFFWRKCKGLERNLSKKHEHPQNVSTIVILKLGSASSQGSEQSSEEHGNKVGSERASTNFLFTEFTRKLKNAMRKEQAGPGNLEKAVGGEGLPMASPTRDHFFLEKIPRKSISAKNRDKAGIKEATELKKPLAETVGTGDAKPLGRILSFSDYSSSPLCSPRKDGERSLMSSPRSLYPSKESENGDRIAAQRVQEDINHNQCSDNSKSGISSEKIVDDTEARKLDIKDECSADEGQEKSSRSTADKIHVEGYMEIIRPTNAELDKRISATPIETMEKQTMCLDLDIVEQNEASSPLTSPIGHSRTSEVEDSDATLDRSDWTSPISVLEPICNEDDVSPRIKSTPVAESIQPRKIKFEDQISPSAPCLKTWEEERLSIFEFVKDVLQESQLTEAQILERFLFGEHLLNQTLFDEVDFLQGCRYYDPKLVYDLIEEVHTEICERGFDGIPSFFKSCIRSDLEGKGIVDEIWKGVNRHLQPEVVQSTLDHTVPKDFSLSSTWMDLRYDSERIGVEVEEEIFDELIEDTILSCIMNQVK